MERYFNTAGPNKPEQHYSIPPLERADLLPVRDLIERGRYFVLHAPRQTGKTTAITTMANLLRTEGHMRAFSVNVEVAQAARNDVAAGMQAIGDCLASSAANAGYPELDRDFMPMWQRSGAQGIVRAQLERFAQIDPAHPAVVFIDEVDALVGDNLISLLRQIRAGYENRPHNFPHAIILCGVRDVRDYRIHSSQGEIITGGSAFNIKDESLRIGDFSRTELETLLAQHSRETGQDFTPQALDYFWEQTRGQPWLTNALGKESCFKPAGAMDRSKPITPEILIAARERLIQARATHLDALADKLREQRLRRVVLPMLVGRDIADDLPRDDKEYAIDLGLIRREGRELSIANPIYREIIPREITDITVDNLATRFKPQWCRRPDQRLDSRQLLLAFQEFWRKESEHGWVGRDYKEAECQLTLQAYLARVVNGGGRIEREYALGAGRTDLAIIWPLPDGEEQRIVIEVKVCYPKQTPSTRIAEGLDQAIAYGERWPGAELHLVHFDRRGDLPWEERHRDEGLEHKGQRIHLWGM